MGSRTTSCIFRICSKYALTSPASVAIRTTVERVFIDGREADLETRQTRLYERYAARPTAE